MDDLSDAEYEAATRRGEIAMRTKPRARTAYHDPRQDRIVVELVDGAVFPCSPRLLQGLETATEAQLAEVEITPVGFGLHWETLDADFTVEGLLLGRFGTRRYMVERSGADREAEAAA